MWLATCTGRSISSGGHGTLRCPLSQHSSLAVLAVKTRELAEATIPILNDQIDQLARTQLLVNEAVLGDIVYSRGYSNSVASDGGMLFQAAVLVPGGVGLIQWDREEYLAAESSHTLGVEEARTRFHRFDELEPAFKALLLPQIEFLIGRLLTLAFPKQPLPAPEMDHWKIKTS